MSRSIDWISDALRELSESSLARSRRVVSECSNGTSVVDGHPVVDFASNDYLNLATDPRVASTANEVLNEWGVGARASALVCGRTVWHEHLERRIADFEGERAAILFPTGMAANIGTVAALCGPGDLVLCDRFNHASLIDGCRLSGAKFRIYRHDDLEGLTRELSKAANTRRRWIITDAVFSMDGDLAPLNDLCNIADRFDAAVIVDEAHGTGIFGERGRGVCEEQNVVDRVAVRIGTLSKSIGALGGFVAGSQELIDYLWNHARSQIYSTALPPAICTAATRAIDLIDSEPERRHRLHSAYELFRRRLVEAGISPATGSVGPIVPIILKSAELTVRVARQLEQQGFLVGAIRPPTVPRDTSRLRIVVTAAHTDEQLNRLACAIANCVHESAST